MSRSQANQLSSVFLVRSEHLNHQGHLFGGDLMAEIDSVAYCLLREIYEGKSFVTRAAEIGFERPARIGDAIRFDAELSRKGTTSVEVQVTGWVHEQRISTAKMVYVNVGTDGKKAVI